jgi:hypothetical protein
VQGRRRRNQPERLVPAVRQEDLEQPWHEIRSSGSRKPVRVAGRC